LTTKQYLGNSKTINELDTIRTIK